MRIQSKIAVVALLMIAVVALLIVSLWQPSLGSWPWAPSGAQPSSGVSAVSATQDPPVTEPAGRAGSLFVRLLWASDRTPAARMAVRVTPPWQVNPVLDRIEGESGDDGTVLIPSIRAGTATVRVLRGGSESVEIEPGKQAEVTVEIPAGLTVMGTVVRRDGRPAAGVEIWLSRGCYVSLLGDVVARSAADGSFRLRDVANASSVGAIDPGRGRSRLLSVSARNAARAADGIHVRLTLREGVGELAGRVLDPAGRPVRGAFVLLGTDHATVVEDDNEVVIREGARTVAACPVMEAETDAAGVFAFHSLTPGRREIVIRARGFAPWTGMVQVTAGASATLEARLARGATLVGTVRTSDGKPVPGAEVATGYADAIASSLARSDAAGAFRLEALPAGRIEVEARTQERGRAKTVLAAREGQELRWDATLVGALELRGRVLDHLGSPLADWTIRVRADTHGPFSWPPVSETKTDPEGRFLIPHCADLPYRVEFEDQSTFTVDVRRVRPGSGELTFRIGAEVRATAFLTGSIVDAEDRPQGDATVWLRRSGPGRDEELQGMTGRATGRFRLGPLPPGRYRLRYAGGNPTCPMFFTEEREVASGATLDLGTLRIVAGGTLRLTAKDETGLDVSGSYGSLLWGADGGQSVASMTFDRGLVRWGSAGGEGDRVLAPGRYVILVGGEGFACARHDFEIRSGGEAHVDLVLRRGTRRTFVIDTVDPDDPLIRARLVVLDAFGKPVSDSGLWFRGESRTTATGWFLPGTYRARATVGSRASEAGFRVEAGAIRGGTVRIVLK